MKLDAHHRGAREYLGELYLDMNQPDNAEKQLAALKKDGSFLSKCEEYDDLKKAVDAYKAKKKWRRRQRRQTAKDQSFCPT